jgi:hypothetical protein
MEEWIISSAFEREEIWNPKNPSNKREYSSQVVDGISRGRSETR